MARVATLTKTNIPMNSKPMCAMKKFWMMLLAAVALTGCQKSEDVVADTNQITIKATMRFDAAARTTIKEQDGNYLARWTEEDKYNIKLVGIRSDGAIWAIDAKDIHLENDGETATFEFAMYPEMMAESFTFVAVNRFAHYGSNSEAVWLQLKDAQTQDGQNYYDAKADLVVSKPIPVEQLTGDLNLNFTMARMNALLKLSLKNFTLAEEEKIQSVTFACEQPLAGIITVNLADLDGVTYPIPYTLHGEESKSITFDLQAGGDLYISTLPATLKAGESYTVTVKTNQATYHKVATLPADLTLTAGDITSVAVNMGDADKATAVAIENLNESNVYAIGYTEGDVTYLLPNDATTMNPKLHKMGEGDLAGLTIENGIISGEVAAAFQWKVEKSGENYSFYRPAAVADYYLISCEKAQGLAVSNTGAGNYSNPYVNTFTLTAKEGGYSMKNSTAGRWVKADSANNRWGQPTGVPAGVINFYRVQTTSFQKSLYPVLTNAADVTEGTYLLLFQNASTGAYYTMSNAMTLTAPAAVAISEIGLTMENGMVTAADVAADYQWIIAATETRFNIKSASDATRFLRQKNNAGGLAVVTKEEYEAAKEVETINGVYEANWKFFNHPSEGLQASAGANERHLGVKSDGTTWAGFKESGLIGHLVLVKLSDSTKQIAANE